MTAYGYKQTCRRPKSRSALTPTADIAVIAPGTMFRFPNPWIVTPRLLRSGCSMTPGAPYMRILPAAAPPDSQTEDANHGVCGGRGEAIRLGGNDPRSGTSTSGPLGISAHAAS